MKPVRDTPGSSASFGRMCEWFCAGCSGLLLVALVLTATGVEPPEERGAMLTLALFVLNIPAGLSASCAITLRGARRSWLAWVAMLPFAVAVALAYAGLFRLRL